MKEKPNSFHHEQELGDSVRSSYILQEETFNRSGPMADVRLPLHVRFKVEKLGREGETKNNKMFYIRVT